MQESNAKISGILSIVSGSLGLLGAASLIFLVVLFSLIPGMDGGFGMGAFGYSDNMMLVMQIIYGIMGAVTLLLSILAIVGGVYALKRKYWGLGLAAAIASILVFFFTGIPAIIFIVMARKEFLPQEAVPVQLNQP